MPTDSNSPYDRGSTVTVLGNTGSSTEDVAFVDFASKNITTSPENGATFTTTDTAVTITYTNDRKTVSQAITIKTALTAADLTYTLTDTTYNKTQHSVTITPNTGVGAVTVKYNGSTTAPINAGAYVLTVNIADGTSFGAATGIVIGNWTILKVSLTISADSPWKNAL